MISGCIGIDRGRLFGDTVFGGNRGGCLGLIKTLGSVYVMMAVEEKGVISLPLGRFPRCKN